MSSYLGDIVSYIRTRSDVSFKESVFMGNDINAIDVAYSETQNHKLSVFFVPGDTVPGDGEGGAFFDTNYFKAYIFVPVEDDVGATDGWEIAIDAARSLSGALQVYAGVVNKVLYLGGREFRVGRGYYIYVCSYSCGTYSSERPGNETITYYRYNGEVDGVATYIKSSYIFCKVTENKALTRDTIGTTKNFGCEVLIPPIVNTVYEPSHKDFFIPQIVSGTWVTSKAVAAASGLVVYEVNSWKDFYGDARDKTFIGRKIIGA